MLRNELYMYIFYRDCKKYEYYYKKQVKELTLRSQALWYSRPIRTA